MATARAKVEIADNVVTVEVVGPDAAMVVLKIMGRFPPEIADTAVVELED